MGQEVTPQMKARSSELEYEGVKLRRTVGYFSGINFLVGVIVGSGIFVSPGGVLKYSNFSVGIALVIWTICGLLSMIGALCYAELGCSLPVSGGEYQYIKRALGPVCAFIFLWTYVIFINPASIAAKALTFAEYAIQPFYPGCPIPELAKKEELKNPSKNIPRCIMTAIPMVTVFYLLVNISYLTVMTPKEVASSASVAITWADRVIGSFSWIIPMSVAISTFGSINGSTFSQGRLNYAASREGHMPPILAMLHVKYLTPAPGIIFSTIISSVFIIPSSLLSLTGYFGFSSWLLVGLTCLSLIVLRFREPTLHRPYKVFLPFAFVMVAVSCFLVLAPIIQSPQLEYIYALLFMLSGLIIYFPFVYFKLHFKFFDKITYHLQLLMEITHSEVYENGSKNQ